MPPKSRKYRVSHTGVGIKRTSKRKPSDPAINTAAEKTAIPTPSFSAAYVAFWPSALSEVAMVLLPTFCPKCNEFTMKVMKYEPDDDLYQARCTACGYHSFGKISPELLIVMGASDNTPRKTG